MKRNRDFEKEKEILKRQQKHTENTEENNFSYEMENEKIESLHVTREMAEDKEMDEKIRQDLIRAADEAEKASQEEEALGTSIPMGAEEKQQLFDDIVNELKRKGIWEEDTEEADGDCPEKGTSPCPARPEDQLSAEDQEALRLGRELLHTPKKKNPTILSKIIKGITGAAVVALGVFVLSMSSEANRVKLLSVWNSVIGEELRLDFNNDDSYIDVDEQKAYKQIKEKLGIEPFQFAYIPAEMTFQDYVINDEVKKANLFYSYKGNVITVSMFDKTVDLSQNQKFDGEIIDVLKVSSEEKNANIWKLNGQGEESYAVEFEYNNAYYSIWGNISKDELIKMVLKIKFKK